jgi:hypothetical protein
MSDTQSTTPVRSRANRGKTPRKRRHPSPPQKPSAGNVLVLTPEPVGECEFYHLCFSRSHPHIKIYNGLRLIKWEN